MKKHAVRDLMLGIENEIGWETGAFLRGINIKRKKYNYIMIITVTTDSNKPMVAFIEANTIYACYEVLAGALYTKSISLTWHIDKYYCP